MEDIDLIRVVDVDYVKDYTMDLKFSNGETRRVNFLPLLKGGKREELKDRNNFIQFGLNHWTLEWYNGIDFAPDYLYRQGTMITSTDDATKDTAKAFFSEEEMLEKHIGKIGTAERDKFEDEFQAFLKGAK